MAKNLFETPNNPDNRNSGKIFSVLGAIIGFVMILSWPIVYTALSFDSAPSNSTFIFIWLWPIIAVLFLINFIRVIKRK
jgi:hypothetical protein